MPDELWKEHFTKIYKVEVLGLVHMTNHSYFKALRRIDNNRNTWGLCRVLGHVDVGMNV